ncbi:MAG: penicillin-binding protein 2, partial [Candidatus Omnitrophica bacterium]|nr:penicillin-binding protein 2 [Candidatus Omnitrophota bacterium]
LKMKQIAEDVFAGHKGAVIIMDALTGEILVLASNPSFDPAAFIAKSNVYLQTVMNDRDAPMMNRAITGLYPPGSVFKLLIAQAALEANKINLSTTYTCPGYLKVGKQKFACWSTHHEQALLEAIAHSCNVFFYHTGLLIGPQQIYEYAVRFGFGRPVGVDLPYEAAGLVPNPFWKKIHQLRNWLDGDTANFSIGQGELLVTPLQVVRMMAVFANKGYLVTPHIVKAIDGKEVSFAKAKRQRLPLHEDALAQVNEGARRVVSLASGTASNLKLLPIAMAGKTGTAQAPPGLSHGWFAGFFPYDKPRYVLCVFVERGSAGYVASFLAKDMMEKMIAQGLFAKDEV